MSSLVVAIATVSLDSSAARGPPGHSLNSTEMATSDHGGSNRTQLSRALQPEHGWGCWETMESSLKTRRYSTEAIYSGSGKDYDFGGLERAKTAKTGRERQKHAEMKYFHILLGELGIYFDKPEANVERQTG